jgi:lipoprotein NlpI
VLPKAREATLRALAIEGGLAEAHASLGLIHMYGYEWKAAESGLRRAIELKPDYPSAHHWYSLQLAFTGRFPEALAESDHALQPSSRRA